MSDKQYPIGGYAPGNYQCKCTTCGGGFIGDKRACQCEPCAIKDKEAFEALSPEEQQEVMKRNCEIVAKLFIESHPSESAGVSVDELWDEFSELIEDDIDSLSMYAGRDVMLFENFKKAAGKISAGVPYQKCPKCNGQGKVLTPPHVPGDAATWSSSTVTDYVCDVCNGMKVIAMGVVNAVWVKADVKPPFNEGVLVFIPGEDNHITSGMWDVGMKWVLLDQYRTPECEVTHWMESPPIPKEYEREPLPNEIVEVLQEIADKELPKELKMDSIFMIGRVKDRFKELEHKKWDWRSFYNGWLEGRADMYPHVKSSTAAQGKEIDVDFVTKCMVDFALWYKNAKHTDLTNDAAEFLWDRMKEKGKTVKEDEELGKEDAVAIMLWSFGNIRAWDKQTGLVTLSDGTRCLTSQLYEIYQSKNK